jgi:gliding motility-associated protein GldE
LDYPLLSGSELWLTLSKLDTTFLYLVGGVCLLLVCSGLISASETSFFSLTPQQLQSCKAGKSKPEKLITELLGNPNLLLATILIANNFVNVSMITTILYLSWELFGKEDPSAVFYSSIIATTLIVFFGEIFPKVLASQYNLTFAKLVAAPMSNLIWFVRPFSWMLMGFGGFIEKRVKRVGYQVTTQELVQALEMATSTQTSSEEKEILRGIITYGSKSVKQVMTPRMDMAAFDIESNFHELLDRINKWGYSRIPVYKETVDFIEGILYIKDLLPHVGNDSSFEWRQFIRRDTLFVLENKKIDELFKEFQKRRVHMAIVVDEYGGTSGLITLEDILEEIIGDINDEFDEADESLYKRLDENTYSFDAKISINDFCKVFDIEHNVFSDLEDEVHTLGGLVIEIFAGLPVVGQKIKFKSFEFVIVSADKKRIKTIKCIKHDKDI